MLMGLSIFLLIFKIIKQLQLFPLQYKARCYIMLKSMKSCKREVKSLMNSVGLVTNDLFYSTEIKFSIEVLNINISSWVQQDHNGYLKPNKYIFKKKHLVIFITEPYLTLPEMSRSERLILLNSWPLRLIGDIRITLNSTMYFISSSVEARIKELSQT